LIAVRDTEIDLTVDWAFRRTHGAEMALVKHADEDEMTIKPANVAPVIDTSDWPLLLKNWEKRKCGSVLALLLLSMRPLWQPSQ